MLTGLGITGLIYILVSISAIALVPPGELGEGEAPLPRWSQPARRTCRSTTSSR